VLSECFFYNKHYLRDYEWFHTVTVNDTGNAPRLPVFLSEAGKFIEIEKYKVGEQSP
jgi:hypothetical protein